MSELDATDLARIEVVTALFAAWSSGDALSLIHISEPTRPY